MVWHMNRPDLHGRRDAGRYVPALMAVFLVLLFASSLDERLSPLFNVLLIIAFIGLIGHFAHHIVHLVSDKDIRRYRRYRRWRH